MSDNRTYGPVSYIGGSMYGDGEYVVEFERSSIAPLKATILGSRVLRSVEFETGTEDNVQTARQVIALARMQDGEGVMTTTEPRPTAECAECGHLHFEGTMIGYSECPIEGCGCQGQAWRDEPDPTEPDPTETFVSGDSR